jgi:hypothetical protein
VYLFAGSQEACIGVLARLRFPLQLEVSRVGLGEPLREAEALVSRQAIEVDCFSELEREVKEADAVDSVGI